MADAVIRFRDKEARLDVIESVEGQVAADIGQLRRELGLTTIDRGFANTAESVSAVSYVGGEEGVLHYRGYL
ncbi:MAG: citrate synthase, partial [Acidimicrobiia bacterium]